MFDIAKKVDDIVMQLFGVAVESEMSRPDPQFGDVSFNVALQLAKSLGKSPREIAEMIAAKLRDDAIIRQVDIAGPGFINLRLTDTSLETYARRLPEPFRQQEKIVIETNNPNPFKAMHIGHALNAITADAVANLLVVSGAEIHRVSYHGDVGAHVGKSMYSLLNYCDGDITRLSDIPEAERNTFMSRMYADGARAYKENDEAKAQINALAAESFTREDPFYAEVYDMCKGWSFVDIDRIVGKLGNKPIEKRYLESEADELGVRTVKAHVPGVFKENDGAIVFEGSKYGSFDNAFVSSIGRGLYAARDLGLMELKNNDYHADKSYIVTAEEQRDYFKGVIAAAELALPELKNVTVNIPTGIVKLTTGKMSSRNGGVIEIEWLFKQIADAISNRGGQATDEMVAGVLRYQFLRVRIGSDIVFDINDAVSLQGNSGPYLQYAHARACSILAKASNASREMSISDISYDAAERALLLKISEASEVVEKAAKELLPHMICNYLYELAQEFNRFYEKSRILGDEREAIRLPLVELYRDALGRGLAVLGIVAPEKM